MSRLWAPVVVLAFLALVYLVAFGRHRPKLRALSQGNDESLLNGARGTRSGLIGAFVAATTVAGIGAGQGAFAYVLVGVLAILVALESRMMREAIYALMGIAAASLEVMELFTGACGNALPSALAPLVAAVPAGFVLLATGFRLCLRPAWTSARIGHVTLAGVAVLELGAFSVFPAGMPLLDATVALSQSWLPVALVGVLSIIGFGCGLHPVAGADLAALGLLTLNVAFSAMETPCGLQLGPAITVVMVFIGVMVVTRWMVGRGES